MTLLHSPGFPAQCPIGTFVLLALSMSVSGKFASASEVDARLSSGQAYVDEPITLQITIENAESYRSPEIPPVDGLQIESAGTPRRSSQTTIINGRVSSRQSVVLQYSVTPMRAGQFEIPALVVPVDGENVRTSPLGFVSTVSQTGDLMLVEIEGKQDKVYVGEPLELTLKIWVKPFRDDELKRSLRESEMWRLFSDRTSWGAFKEALVDLAQQRKRPGGENVIRKNPDGQSQRYYLYEVDTTIYPNKPGKIDASDVRIVMDYPLELRMDRRRSLMDDFFGGAMGPPMGDPFNSAFGSELVISKSRPISATASVDATEVIPLPTEGRPESFQGAVGRYKIEAKTDVRGATAGDPITFQISISGDGPLESIQAPPLSALDEGFRIDGQPLAGFIRDGVKYFTTTIRPIDETVTSIPSIEMSFFNPETETFETVETDAIAIDVNAAERLALDSIVGPDTAGSDTEDQADGTTDVLSLGESLRAWSPLKWLLANRAYPAVLDSESSSSLVRWALMLYGFPVALFSIIATVRFRERFRERLPMVWQWFRPARQRAVAQLNDVASPHEIPIVLQRYVEQAFGVHPSKPEPDWHGCLGVLRSSGMSDLAAELESLCYRCEIKPITSERGDAGNTLERRRTLIADAERWLTSAETSRQSRRRIRLTRSRGNPSNEVRRSIARIGLLGLMMSLPLGEQGELHAESVAVLLEPSQQESLLRDAHETYETATKLTMQDDIETARETFIVAASKYQTLIDSGIENGGLHANLGNAYFQANQLGHAIAHYRTAQSYRPLDLRTQINLVTAQARVGLHAQDWFVPLIALLLGVLLWWIGGWKLASRWMAGKRLSWGPLIAMVLAIGCLVLAVYQATSNAAIAIAVVPELELRSGDGESFEAIATLEKVEGRSFPVKQQRGDWWLIQASPETQGWVHENDVVAL